MIPVKHLVAMNSRAVVAKCDLMSFTAVLVINPERVLSCNDYTQKRQQVLGADTLPLYVLRLSSVVSCVEVINWPLEPQVKSFHGSLRD